MSNRKYSKSFKLDAVSMALSSEKSHAQIARDLGLKETSLYAWISQYRGEVLGANHDMTAEQELAALKKRAENIQQGLYVPLSSGHDSGLIAAELEHLGIGFHAYGFRYGDVIPPINNRS